MGKADITTSEEKKKRLKEYQKIIVRLKSLNIIINKTVLIMCAGFMLTNLLTEIKV